MPDVTVCPNPAKLSQLLIGNASAVDLESFAGHLENCPNCIKQLEQIERSRQVGKQSVRSGPPVPVAAPVQTIMDRIQKMVRKRIDPHHTANTPAPYDPITQTAMGGAGGKRDSAYSDSLAWLEPPQSDDEIGRIGGYRILKALGEGGMGVVYLAEDAKLKRLVALKAMKKNMAASSDGPARFLREAQMMATVKHRNVVAIYHADEHNQVAYLAMEYLQGESLEQCLQRAGRLSIAEMVRIGREIAEGLAAAHAKGLIHRDIKPANLWLEFEPGASATGGCIKVLDFGLARAVKADVHLTQSGTVLGTPAYMAPEQAAGRTVDARCDLFSLGVVLYRMATGKLPFDGTDFIQIIQAIALVEPQAPHLVNPKIPKEISGVIMKLLAKRPEERFGSAAQLVTRLRQLERVEPPKTAEADHDKAATVTFKAARVKETQRIVIAGTRSLKDLLSRKWWIAIGASVTLSALLIALLAGGVLHVRTPEGTIVLADLPDGAEVFVDGNRVTVRAPGPGDPWEIRTKPGSRKLEVRKGGFKAFSSDVALDAGGRTLPIQVRLEPNTDAPAGPKDAFRKPIINSIGMKLAYIAPGWFHMGSPTEELQHRDTEFRHKVELTNGFYMGVYAVTQDEYRTVMGENPSCYSAQGGGRTQVAGLETGRFPVETVTWNQAKEFCRKLSQTEGKTYSLPTEAEWEYACRAGTTTPFHFGATISTNQANFNGDSVYGNGAKGEFRYRTIKVGNFPANAWGLHDMHGNVWQWCEDWYDAKYYENSPKTNPLNENPGQYRVVRGGSWFNTPGNCRSAYRGGGPGLVLNFVGFRVVLRSVDSTPPEQPPPAPALRAGMVFEGTKPAKPAPNGKKRAWTVRLAVTEIDGKSFRAIFTDCDENNGKMLKFDVTGKQEGGMIQWDGGSNVYVGTFVAGVIDCVRKNDPINIRMTLMRPSDGRPVWTHPGGKFEQVNDKAWLEQVGDCSWWFRETQRTDQWVELQRAVEPSEKIGARAIAIRLHRDTATISNDEGPWAKIYDGIWSSLPSGPPVSFAGTTWSGMETRANFGKFRFEFHAGDKVTMIGAKVKMDGTYVLNGAAITLRFGAATYTGSANGKAMSGAATNTKERWKWKITRE